MFHSIIMGPMGPLTSQENTYNSRQLYITTCVYIIYRDVTGYSVALKRLLFSKQLASKSESRNGS